MRRFEISESGTEPGNKVVNIPPALQTPFVSGAPGSRPGRQGSEFCEPRQSPSRGGFHLHSLLALVAGRRDGGLWGGGGRPGQGAVSIQRCSRRSQSRSLLVLKFAPSQRVEMPEFNTTSLSAHSAKCPWLFNKPNLLALGRLHVLRSLFLDF